MSLNSFIPSVWSSELLVALMKAHVYAALANHDYEGEIKSFGDTVRINAIGDITISAYVKDTDIAAPQELADAQTTLTITQADYFNFAVDDVDAAQQNPKVMTEAMKWAAYKLADAVDTFVAGKYTETAASNLIGTSGAPVTVAAPTQANVGGGTTVYDYLVVLDQKLTENNVPKVGRWGVVPPWIKTYLMMDIRFTSFNTEAARQSIMSGNLDASGGQANEAYLGKINALDVYESNNAPHLGGTAGAAGSQDVVLCGHSMALTFAEGVSKVEAYRPQYRFSDAVKGLHLYGSRVVRPYALAVGNFQHP